MKALLQRVSTAAVDIDGDRRAEIKVGLLIFLGVLQGDQEEDACRLAAKIVSLRIFNDTHGKMQRSLLDVDGSALVVSQFTLAADCCKGRRPSFIQAAPPDQAQRLYEFFVEQLRSHGIAVATGEFAAAMEVSLCNSGPVTIMLDSQQP